MASIFCDSEGNSFVEFLKRGATLNTELCVQKLNKLKNRIRRFRVFRKMNQGESSPHPPYRPDLAPSDFHLLGPMKDELGGLRFADTTS